MKIKNIFIIYLLLIFLISCKNRSEQIITVETFLDTPEYELAKAVEKEDLKEIRRICGSNYNFISKSYKEKYYSVLHWAVSIGKYKATKELLELGMNPNIQDKDNFLPLDLCIANIAVFPILDLSQMVELLISYGADCNFEHDIEKYVDMHGITPFQYAAFYNRENIMRIMLQHSNIDINKKTNSKCFITAADYALCNNKIESAYFLICECKAKVVDDFFYNQDKLDVPITPVSLLRNFIFPLDTKEYQMKLDIINEFKKQGIDYYSEPIPNNILLRIKKEYPENWEEYIKVY